MPTQTTFVVDDSTAKALHELKKEFGVTTNAAVIRKALALARVAAKNAGDYHTFTFVDKEQKEQKILLTG